MSGNILYVCDFIRTSDSVRVPDIQFEFIPFLGEFHNGRVQVDNGFQYYFSLMRPTSAGRVTLRSGNPHDPPAFQFNYLSTPEDEQTAVDAIRAIRTIVRQSAWSSLRGVEVAPGSDCTTDALILGFLRASAGTNYHPGGSCRMGIDEQAVVDAHARVRGVRNLRVIDAAILPEMVTGNLNAPVIMMAEKLADHIRGRTPLAPESAPYYHG
jgi:choline dehydrogenase